MKKRVLEVSLVSHNTGGVEKILYDIFTHIDLQQFQIDFLSPDGGSYDVYADAIYDKGGRLFDLNVDRTSIINKIVYNYRLFKFLRKNPYDIVHVNSGAFFFCLQATAVAKLCNVPAIIAHSHNTMCYESIKGVATRLLKPLLELIVDERLSCSIAAASSLFSNKTISAGNVTIIKNGIDIDLYRFDKQKRADYRSQFDVEGNCVYGHVGRFDEQKNHIFLIDIFNEIHKRQPKSKLLLIGEGPLRKTIEMKVEEYQLQEDVLFLGRREDVSCILSSMDVFLLPSLYEGLPIVAIEAQTNGLRTVCSDAVTTETCISDTYLSIPLENAASEWADIIIKAKLVNPAKRAEQYKSTIKAGYDIRDIAKQVETIYDKY